MERLETGNISLFQHYTSKITLINEAAVRLDNNGVSVGPGIGVQKEKNIEKYIKIANTDIAIDLNDSGKIMGILKDYFADCPRVLKELKIIAFISNNLEDLIWQYNRECKNVKAKPNH